jgi:uncharacterized protein (DUF433 family)
MQIFYTPTEIAQVIGIPLKAVNKILDTDHIGRKAPRELAPKDVLYVMLVSQFRTMAELKPQGRWLIKKEVDHLFKKSSDLSKNVEKQLQLNEFRFDLEPFVQHLKRGVDELEKAKKLVVEDKNILGGEPVIKGTRISVYLIATMLKDGATVNEICKGYPSLKKYQIELARAYAAAYPRRGRPLKHNWGL